MAKKMYSNEEIEEFIAEEGLEDCVLSIVPVQMIQDEELAKAWKMAKEGLDEIVKIFDIY